MKKVYTPIQIVLGIFLGGPFAAIYFLKSNFDILGKEDFSKRTLQIGLVFSLVILVALPFLPDATPNSVISVLYLIPVILTVQKYQLTKEEIANSEEYSFQSSWKVFGMSVVWVLAFVIVSILVTFALETAGIVSL